MATAKTLNPIYQPTAEEAASRSRLYKNLQYMIDLKKKAMPHFSGPNGNRSWLQMIDDAEKILNGFTLSRADQGKEDWQSNMMDNIARAKMRAIAAGVGLRVPRMDFTAVGDNGIQSADRAEIFKNIVQQTYRDANPTLNAFLETWHMLAHGVVFEYEGYKTGGAYQDVIDSFDSLTGKVTTKREYRKMDGKPFSTIIGPQEFYWWTFLVRDIQQQPRLSWVQHYTKRELELEFSKFPNYKYLKDKKQASNLAALQDSTYFNKWSERVTDVNDYEVVRMFSKEDDGGEDENGNVTYGYEIWVNGIPLLQCPLLWGDKEKWYPIAKQLPEWFANTNFFVGIPFPILLEAYQDQKNTLINTLTDKLYRSMDPIKLVGLQNKDLLDVESAIHGQDNTIYVPDINAVKFMPNPTINQGELAMFNILNTGIELLSVDRAQQGQSGGANDKTAHEVVLADQRAQELKGALYMALEDFWYQKTKLRTKVILTHFIKDKAAQDSVKGQIITIKDYTFGDGSRGILDIHVAKTKGKLMSQKDIEARELAMKKQGIEYKLVSITQDYLNDYEYDFKVQPDSFRKQDRAEEEQELMSEIQQVTTLFPEFFVANKDKYLTDILGLRGKHLDQFNKPAPPPPPPGPAGPPGAPPGGAPPGAPPTARPTPNVPNEANVLGL